LKKVLNALRHRRWNQFEAAYLIGVSINSAQRLAASKMESEGWRSCRPERNQVLNALRHRRWNQKRFFAIDWRIGRVLNALRHRRWNQHTVKDVEN